MGLKIRNLMLQQYLPGANELTHKQLGIHECILSTVATDAMALKHQAISIYGAE